MEENILKAVYYCRVSTEEESQANALEAQIQESQNCIIENNWEMIDGYVDEGKSGTQTKKRDEYNRLYTDISANKFDIIVVKSQDRLMRNVKDWYLFIDKLITNGKKLYFYLENKFYTPDDALITGIKAILAEEYSRDLSKKLNNAHKNRQKKGESFVLTSSTWGYDKINKQVVINEKEAEVVRLIYNLYVEGYGSRSISKELSNRGIKSRTGNDFAEVTIRKIIRNPLFKGTIIMNKRHRDFNTKETIHTPKEEWIIHENAVPAIISESVWEKANKIMDQRSKEVKSDKFGVRRVGKNIGKYDLSNKIICGECGSVYWRRYRKNVKGEQIVDWSCSKYIKRGRKKIHDTRGLDRIKIETKGDGCDNIHIKEEDFNNILLEVSKDIFRNRKKNVLDEAADILNLAISDDKLQKEKQQLENEKNKIITQKNLLLDKLLDDVITNADYKRKDTELETRLNLILEKENIIIEQEKQIETKQERLNDIEKYLTSEGEDLKDIDKIIEHIIEIKIFTEHIEIYLDFYDPIRVKVEGNNKNRKYLYVETSKYLIPHTDRYRHNGEYREVSVKIAI